MTGEANNPNSFLDHFLTERKWCMELSRSLRDRLLGVLDGQLSLEGLIYDSIWVINIVENPDMTVVSELGHDITEHIHLCFARDVKGRPLPSKDEDMVWEYTITVGGNGTVIRGESEHEHKWPSVGRELSALEIIGLTKDMDRLLPSLKHSEVSGEDEAESISQEEATRRHKLLVETLAAPCLPIHLRYNRTLHKFTRYALPKNSTEFFGAHSLALGLIDESYQGKDEWSYFIDLEGGLLNGLTFSSIYDDSIRITYLQGGGDEHDNDDPLAYTRLLARIHEFYNEGQLTMHQDQEFDDS